MRRGISAVAMAAAIVLGATACGGNGGGDGKSDSGKAQDPASISGTLTYWDTSDAKNEAPTYQALVKAFEAKYPKIKVNYQNVDFGTVEQKFKAAAQSGKGAPDVVRTDVGLIPEYASLHYIAPLDGTTALQDTGDFMAGPMNTTKYDGKTYGVPSVTDTLGLLYNKDIFAKAGITKAPATWDELIADSATIKQKVPGVAGTYVNPDSYFLFPVLFGEGADLADPAAKKITINSPEAVKAVTEAKKIYDTSSLKVDFASAYDNMQTSFKTGKVAMLIQGPWSVGDDLTGSAFQGKEANLGYAPVPAGSSGKALAPTGGHDLAVYQGSKNLDAAYLFTQFMTSSASQQQIALKNGTLPTRTSAYTDAVLKNGTIAGFKPIMDTARPRVALPQVGSLFTPLQQQYIKILQGQTSVQAGLDAAAKDFGKLLPGYAVQ
ncbi:extracellular solute-binding protein [Actinacidiphila rubida]|uniref:Arabinogalactan oligomer / maltooligosaccharide transport system substrate-binding protein n=1 Tax=Actinacidiphila rubida TaxID=310780 RepID=A0A1H8NAG8_9ACTN|nr:extracellular solute-binding protein [Actinacidiphila rubida]SEO26423.1 arabinogalactan oligomer / maltooligosaccharide transport system substrate-binding protein [Actinacidiphila rubida]